MNLAHGVSLTVFDASRTFSPFGVFTTIPQCVHLDIVPILIYGDWNDLLSMKIMSPSLMSDKSVLRPAQLHISSTATIMRNHFILLNHWITWLIKKVITTSKVHNHAEDEEEGDRSSKEGTCFHLEQYVDESVETSHSE